MCGGEFVVAALVLRYLLAVSFHTTEDSTHFATLSEMYLKTKKSSFRLASSVNYYASL